jgi:hypothetical protein
LMQAILTALMRMACAARTTFFMKISACEKAGVEINIQHSTNKLTR